MKKCCNNCINVARTRCVKPECFCHRIRLSEATKKTYIYIEQEFKRIERAMEPLKKHLEYLRDIGSLE